MKDGGRTSGSIQANVLELTWVYRAVMWDFHVPMLSLVSATLPCGFETKPIKEGKINLVVAVFYK